MLDTLKVYTDDFRVQDGASLTVQPAPINYQDNAQRDSRLFQNSAREWVTGAKAYINNEHYNLTIKPNMIGDGVKAFIQFSLPKALTGDNYHPIKASEITQAKRLIGQDIAEKGILLDLEECKVSRIDAFRNAYSEEPFLDYTPLFRMLRAQRQLKRDYGSTFLWSNTQREICVYDKNEEVRLRGGAMRGAPPNAIRFEYRLLNTRVTKKETGIDRLRDINNFDAVREAYDKALKKHLFSLTVSEVNVLAATQLEVTLQSYRDKGSRYWITEFLKDYGAYTVLNQTNVETLKAILERVTGDRKTAWKSIKDIEESRNTIALMSEGANQKTLADLYQELEGKVLNVTD